MNKPLKNALLGLSLPLLLLLDASPDGSKEFSLIREADAVFGRPFTPVSVAGVARRTTRRTVAVTSTAAAASATAATTTSEQPAAAPPPAATQPAGSLPIGTIVAALPAGCESTPSGGIQYYSCDGTRYRPAFQGNNLVYVVQ